MDKQKWFLIAAYFSWEAQFQMPWAMQFEICRHSTNSALRNKNLDFFLFMLISKLWQTSNQIAQGLQYHAGDIK